MGEKTNRITKSLGLKEDTQHHLISCIKQLLTQLEIPKSLSEIGVPDNCAKRIAKKAMFDTATSTNPVKVIVTDIEKLINASIIS
jgi:alcohol dehydrogenase class IV